MKVIVVRAFEHVGVRQVVGQRLHVRSQQAERWIKQGFVRPYEGPMTGKVKTNFFKPK